MTSGIGKPGLADSWMPPTDPVLCSPAYDWQSASQLASECFLLPSASVVGVDAAEAQKGMQCPLDHQDSWDVSVNTPFAAAPALQNCSGSCEVAAMPEHYQVARLPSLPSQQYPSQVTSGIPNLVVPASAFTGPQKDQLDSQHVIISICRPQQDTKDAVSVPLPVLMPTPDAPLKSHQLSWSDSEQMEELRAPWRSGSLSMQKSLSTTSSAPAEGLSGIDRDALAVVRPTIQTGTHCRSDSAPPVTAGKRVLRTGEERKAHRMAKNRATAAASRQRKQAAQQDLLGRQEQLELENARLLELLSSRESQMQDIRKQIALATARHSIVPQADLHSVCNPFAQARGHDVLH